ncbi:hypothetical protein BDB01DRAFT_690787, partial [Pilobolus umbonatus]
DIYGCPNKKDWALTFDDGPSQLTNELLDILDDMKVKVTFCLMGSQVEKYPEIVKRAFKAGHQITSHTYSHPHLMSLTNEEIIFEVRAAEEAIYNATGVRPRYIRPPYGEADERVKTLMDRMGYKVLMWNVDPTDYNVHMKEDGAALIQDVFEKTINDPESVHSYNGDQGFISLQHDLYGPSINQVPFIIDSLKRKGYSLVTVAECL